MTSIDGSGEGYPIGECDSASRVIKYVVTLCYRTGSYNPVDLRIHDVNVTADCNRRILAALEPTDQERAGKVIVSRVRK
jgi:hypothetical protein